MTLYERLKTAKSEQDVKDIYIKAIGLKKTSKNLIDIETKEIWFEAKIDGKTSVIEMYTQLLFYVQKAIKKGENIPPFLCVIDTTKAAIMKTSNIMPFLENNKIDWGKSASNYSDEAFNKVSTFIGTHYVKYIIESHEKEFIEAVRNAIKSGEIMRTNITPDNLKQVFDKWVKMIGNEIEGAKEEDYVQFFFADVMHDGKVSTHQDLAAQLMHRNDSPVFSMNDKVYALNSIVGYNQFWSIYQKPPKKEYRNYLLERRDSLIPINERVFKGAYYTKLDIVDKAYDLLAETLGKKWQDKYILWDMCCGVGNLEVKHINHRQIYMSTLDMADIDIMKSTKTCSSAFRFQYDYLNDDINDNGDIDYSLTNKLPEQLRKDLNSDKKILILINPPYAEATNTENINLEKTKSKNGVANTKAINLMSDYGHAKRELFSQFLCRIEKEIPNATLAIFSTMKYINSGNFEIFRKKWKAKYLNGFIVHSKAFDGLKGDFPIGFLIWDLSKKEEISKISTSILDKNGKEIGSKNFYNVSSNNYLNNLIPRLKTNSTSVPLKNCVTPKERKAKVTAWRDDAIGYFWCNGNDMQQANQTAIFSSVFNSGNGFYITKNNYKKVALMFTARHSIKHTWQNHNDQFFQPNKEITLEFESDCLIYMLFHGKNLTAGAKDIIWDNRNWNLVNHFIPFCEDDVEANDRFESDFIYSEIKKMRLSIESTQVLEKGKDLWREFFRQIDGKNIRQELMLNRPDVGWYQIRTTLKKRIEQNDSPINFSQFEKAYNILELKIVPQIYNYGIMLR